MPIFDIYTIISLFIVKVKNNMIFFVAIIIASAQRRNKLLSVLVMNFGKYDFEALRAPSERAENKDVWNEAGSGAFRLTPARGRSSGAPKNACVFRGRPNLVEPAWPSQGPQGPQRFLRWWCFSKQ